MTISKPILGTDPQSALPRAAITAPATLTELVNWRRDVRRFRTDPVAPELLADVLRLADRSPSVGNSQPWRIVNIQSAAIRARVRVGFEHENARAAETYGGDQATLYRRLKLAGFDNAPVHLAVFADRTAAQGHGLGQRTMPETLDQSAVCMITLLWLAAREQGLGLGWVSIIDPVDVALAIGAPADWHLVGYLLIGYPEEEHLDPELERAGWQARTVFETRYFEVTPDTPLADLIVARDVAQTADAQNAQPPLPTLRQGRVYLVGAGPGDPHMLTRQAHAVLSQADVVLHDDLVSDAVLSLIRPGAETIHVGKRGYRPSCKQPDINALIVERALRGQMVVRLKSGDPMIFGRAGEEISACRDAGVAIDIVPGITSAQGAAARLGISLTHRDFARRLQFITAHDRNGHLPPDIDWSAIADPAATTVVYMPKRTLPELTAQAIARGLPGTTPAIAIANATRADQWVLHATVATIAAELEAANQQGPVLVMIGEAMGAVVDGEVTGQAANSKAVAAAAIQTV